MPAQDRFCRGAVFYRRLSLMITYSAQGSRGVRVGQWVGDELQTNYIRLTSSRYSTCTVGCGRKSYEQNN